MAFSARPSLQKELNFLPDFMVAMRIKIIANNEGRLVN
jgi:hypothetical protein